MTICVIEGCGKIAENLYCASHAALLRKAERQESSNKEKRASQLQKANEKKFEKKDYVIPKISQKQNEYLARYVKEKQGFLNNKPCAVYPEERATDIHHMWSRSINSFADQWAVDNDIPLLLDKRYWLPVSERAHRKITDDSAWAVENNYSIPRNTPTLKA